MTVFLLSIWSLNTASFCNNKPSFSKTVRHPKGTVYERCRKPHDLHQLIHNWMQQVAYIFIVIVDAHEEKIPEPYILQAQMTARHRAREKCMGDICNLELVHCKQTPPAWARNIWPLPAILALTFTHSITSISSASLGYVCAEYKLL